MDIKARLKWTEGFQFVAQAGDGPAVVIDTLEKRSGPSPMEMVLIGIAGCTAVDVLSIMQKKRVTLTGFQVQITGRRAEEHPRRYTHIHVEYLLQGKEIKPKAVQQAIALSETKYCGALASLNADFEHAYRITESE